MEIKCSFLLDKIKSYAETQPQTVAIQFNDQKLSYANLWQQIENTAQKLLGATGIIGIHVERTPRLIILMLACWEVGCAYLALDKKHPLQRKLSILHEASPSLMVCDDEAAVNHFTRFGATLLKNNITKKSIEFNSKTPSSLAYLLYTSGSTGKPKGVMIGEYSIEHLVRWATQYYNDSKLRCVLASTTVTFDLSVFEIFVPLFSGNSICLVESILSLFDKNLQNLENVTLINTVPSAMREIVRMKALPKNCHVVNLAGEVLPAELVKNLYQFRQVKEVYNLWGPSEDTTYSTVYLCKNDSNLDEKVPIGEAIIGSKVHLMNVKKNEYGHDVGEICLSGLGLSLGYLNNPNLTNKLFTPHPKIPNLKIYHTGDLGYFDKNNQLQFCGRKDFQVKVRGYRIELEEIEATLYKHPSVIECIVSAIKGEQSFRLAASIMTKDKNLNESELKKHLRKILPEYMVPSNIFLSNKPLARTSNGKLCRQTSLKILEDKFSNKTIEEISFNSILKKILSCENICLSESFLNQGGDSLQAIRLTYELQHNGLGQLNLKDLLNKENSLQFLKNRLSPCINISVPQKEQELTNEDRVMWKAIIQHTSAYNISVILTLRGDFIQNRLVHAIETVINNEAVFHRNYASDAGEIKPIFQKKKIKVIQIPYNGSDKVMDSLSKDTQKVLFEKDFNLEKDILVRICLITSAKNIGKILFCAPHIAIDGIGMEALLRKISRVYRGEKVSSFEETSKQLSACNIKINQNDNAYWKSILSEAVNVQFPSQTSKISPLTSTCHLTKIQVKDLNKRAIAMNMTVPSLMLSLFQCLLHKIDLGEKIFAAVPIANRYFDHEQATVANFTKSLPILSCFLQNQALRVYLKNQHTKFIETLNHKNVDFSEVLELLPNQKNNIQLFDIIFSYMDFAHDQLKIGNCDVRREFYIQKKKKAPLVFSVIKNKKSEIELRFETDTRYFSKKALESILECYMFLLENFESDLDSPLAGVDILPKKQRKIIYKNRHYKNYSYQQTLTQTLFSQFKKSLNKVAIIDGNQKISYKRLLNTALTIASGLKGIGIRPGNAIGISLDKNWLCVATIIGVLFNGCHYVPIDKRNPEKRIQYIKKNAEIDIIISDKKNCINVLSLNKLLESKITLKMPEYHPNDLAYIIYTSGTTGDPKGVTITQKNVMSLFDSCNGWLNYSGKDVWTLFHSYAFDFSVWEIFGALLSSACLIVVPEITVSSPFKFAKLLEKYQVTMLSQTPTALKNLLHYQRKIEFKPRYIFFGGEALTMDVLERWYEQQGRETQLVNMYGITEVTVHASYYLIDGNSPTTAIGKPLVDTGIMIVGKHNQLLPIGFHGELCIMGDGLSEGYWRKEKSNQEKFILDTHNERIYLSGDIGSLQENGVFYYHGRLDKQFKLNGYRLEKEEITNIMKSVKGITQVELKTTTIEGGIQIICAYYLAENPVKDSLIYQQMKLKLPIYAIPSAFIHLKKYPLTINGKIDYQALPDPSNKLKTSFSFECSEKSKTSITSSIRNIWEKVLQATIESDKRVFFELGGNSMKAVILSQQLSKSFENLKFTVIDVFRYPTIIQQSKIIQQRILEGSYD